MINEINKLSEEVAAPSQSSDTLPPGVSKLALFIDSIKTHIKSSIKIVILQHPQERKEDLATVPIIKKCIPDAVIKVGLSWPNLKKILGDEIDNSRWAVIYLGTQAESEKLKKSQAVVSLIGKAKKISNLEGIVLLDGSWRETKTLWWRNAWLLKLNRIVLNPEKPAIYNALRKEPRKESVSTLEAIALVLAEVEKRTEIYDELTAPLNELVKLVGTKKRTSGPKRDWRRKKSSRTRR